MCGLNRSLCCLLYTPTSSPRFALRLVTEPPSTGQPEKMELTGCTKLPPATPVARVLLSPRFSPPLQVNQRHLPRLHRHRGKTGFTLVTKATSTLQMTQVYTFDGETHAPSDWRCVKPEADQRLRQACALLIVACKMPTPNKVCRTCNKVLQWSLSTGPSSGILYMLLWTWILLDHML